MKIITIYKTIKPLFDKYPREIEKPKVIQFPVIDICNSKCQMCRIWENKKSKDISIEDLKKGLEDKLFSDVQSIGLNGGEPTLRKDLPELVSTIVNSLPKLKSVSLITNAFKVEQVTQQIGEISKIIKSKGLVFDVMVSLDGYEGIHDKVRGRSGNFTNAKKVIEYIRNNKDVDQLRIGCTIIKENSLHLFPLLEFCIKENLYIKFRLGVPHQRLYTENLLDPYAISFEEKYEIVEFLNGLIEHYETSIYQKFFYQSLIDQIISNKARRAGCNWQYKGATITAKGELAYCAVKSKVLLDNISNGSSYNAYFSNKRYLKELVENECDKCTHDYVGLPSPKYYRGILLEYLNNKTNIKSYIKRIPGLVKVNKKRNEYKYLNRLESLRNSKNVINNVNENTTNIMICGWYGTETLGDKAIIGGIINTLEDKYGDNFNLHVVSLNTYITEMTKIQMSEFKRSKIFSLEEGISASKDMDLILFGGGPLMAIGSLAGMQVIFEKARENNVKTIIAGCGVGPLGEKWLNNSISKILKLSDVRIYRDKKSMDLANELGINTSNDYLAEDPAFTWLTNLLPNISNDNYTRNDDNSKTILLGLRDFPYKEYAKHLSIEESLKIKENYEKSVIEALEVTIQKYPNIIIKPLPMCTNHFGSDDRWFYRRLFRNKSKLRKSLDLSLLCEELSPEKYVREFLKSDLLIAMRFHSLVFGVACGTKSIALDYTLGKGKVASLAKKHNINCTNLQDLTRKKLNEMIDTELNSNNESDFDSNNLKFKESLLSALQK